MYEVIVGRDESDKKKLGDKGTIFLGKLYVKMGPTTSMSNKILMDVARSHVILVDGKRGCLSGDSKIFTNHGFKEFKEFDEKTDKIYSYNTKMGGFEWENARLLKYPIKNEKLLELKFYDGHSLKLTKEHPLLVFDGEKEIWKVAKDLRIGDEIIAITKVPEVRNDKESCRIARLLGFILADGTMSKRNGKWKDGRGYWYNGTKSRIRIFNACNEVLKTAKEDLEKEFGIKAKRYKRNDCNCEVIETKQRKVLDKFVQLGIPLGDKSKIIRVPKVVFESSNKFKANFIKALFSCDGFIAKHGGRVEYTSNSKLFLEDLHLLLNHFNIQSTIRQRKKKCNNKYFTSYNLYITDYTSLQNFKKRINFFNPFKSERLDKHKFWRMERRKKTTYFDKYKFGLKISEINEIGNINEVYDLNVPKNHSFITNGVISHNSGKSYTLSVIAEEIANLPEEVADKLSVLMFDTMGIFWTMKYPNEREEDLLTEWNLKPKALERMKVYTPIGYYDKLKSANFPTDAPFAIKPSELNAGDWSNVFGISLTEPIGVLIERVIDKLQDEGLDYEIKDIIKAIHEDAKTEAKVKFAAENRFVAADGWGLFSREGTPIKDIVDKGKVTVLDVSQYTYVSGAWGIKNLVIGLVCRKLLTERMTARKIEELRTIEKGYSPFFEIEEELEEEEMPLVWILLDEAHESLPKEGSTPATDALVQILREGRQPGISLVLATQQPGEIHRDVITQSDVVISHRITARRDIEALNNVMQTYLAADVMRYLNELPSLKGSAIILDDTAERIFPMRVRPKFSWHGGEAPTAVKIKRKEIEELGL